MDRTDLLMRHERLQRFNNGHNPSLPSAFDLRSLNLSRTVAEHALIPTSYATNDTTNYSVFSSASTLPMMPGMVGPFLWVLGTPNTMPQQDPIVGINTFIQANLETLSKDSMKVGIDSVPVTLEDCITFEDFDFDSGKEWCLLRLRTKKDEKEVTIGYRLITADSVSIILRSPECKHPYSEGKLKVGDIIRGQEVLDIFRHQSKKT